MKLGTPVGGLGGPKTINKNIFSHYTPFWFSDLRSDFLERSAEAKVPRDGLGHGNGKPSENQSRGTRTSLLKTLKGAEEAEQSHPKVRISRSDTGSRS